MWSAVHPATTCFASRHFFDIDETATPEVGFVITLSTALEVVDADDVPKYPAAGEARRIRIRILLIRMGDLDWILGMFPCIQFSADAASAAWGDLGYVLTLPLDLAGE